MADCTIRRRDESWVEVVLPTPTYAGELGKAHQIMMGELGCAGTIANDDIYTVVVGDDEIILRAKAPQQPKVGQDQFQAWAYIDEDTQATRWAWSYGTDNPGGFYTLTEALENALEAGVM